MSIFSKLELRHHLLSAILVIVLAIVLTPFGNLFYSLWDKFFGLDNLRIVLQLLVSLCIVIIVILSWDFHLHKKLKLYSKYKFGVFWDSKNNPRCPHCGGKFKDNSEYPKCPRCSNSSHVGSPSGNTIERITVFTRMKLSEAKKEVGKDEMLNE